MTRGLQIYVAFVVTVMAVVLVAPKLAPTDTISSDGIFGSFDA